MRFGTTLVLSGHVFRLKFINSIQGNLRQKKLNNHNDKTKAYLLSVVLVFLKETCRRFLYMLILKMKKENNYLTTCRSKVRLLRKNDEIIRLWSFLSKIKHPFRSMMNLMWSVYLLFMKMSIKRMLCVAAVACKLIPVSAGNSDGCRFETTMSNYNLEVVYRFLYLPWFLLKISKNE